MKNKKKCSDCGDDKLLSEFYHQADRKNGASKCKSCHNKYCINRWRKIKIEAIRYKGNKCVKCGNSHPEYPPAIFEFHHLDPSKKDVSWGKLRLRSWNKIELELDKCDMVCANCHRIIHYSS
jgi:hypothetical protein